MQRDADYRRYHEARIKRKVRGYPVVKMHLKSAPEREAEILSRWERTRPACSCWMCSASHKRPEAGDA